MRDTVSFTLRFADRGGAHAALSSVASALDSVGAPRPVADDVRLAVEIALDDALGGPTDGGVLGVAAAHGRIALEVRTSPPWHADSAALAALVDEVEVTHVAGQAVVALARSWNGRRADDRGDTGS